MLANNTRNPLNSVLAFILLLLIVYQFSGWPWLIIGAIAIGFFSIIIKDLAKEIDIYWFRIAWTMGKIIPNVLLIFIFYVLLTPLALLYRFLRKNDPLKMKNDNVSLFIENIENIDKKYFEKLW